MQYDDMEGLEFAEYGGLGAWIDMELIKQAAVAGASGAGALMLGSLGINYATEKLDFLKRETPEMQKVQNGAIQFALGVAGGSYLMRFSQEAGMGVLVGLGSVGVANVVNGLLKDKAVSFSALPEDMELSDADESLLSDYDDGMEALAALETTGVTSSPGAFQGLGDPTVTPEHLMGTVVQQEQLGAYAPYLS